MRLLKDSNMYGDMKVVTMHVDEAVYADLQSHARAAGRTTADIVREAMAEYHRAHVRSGRSLRELQPLDLGGVREPWTGRESLLDDLLERP